MPAHAVLPAAALALGLLALAASRCRRLPSSLWPITGVAGLGALAVPALSGHYASDLVDLLALAGLTTCAFAAVGHASRTRVAQLSPWWRGHLDEEWQRLCVEEPPHPLGC
ncbi:MAG: hypothetical protein ABIU87_01545 [Ornithinibacter sp.]